MYEYLWLGVADRESVHRTSGVTLLRKQKTASANIYYTCRNDWWYRKALTSKWIQNRVLLCAANRATSTRVDS